MWPYSGAPTHKLPGNGREAWRRLTLSSLPRGRNAMARSLMSLPEWVGVVGRGLMAMGDYRS